MRKFNKLLTRGCLGLLCTSMFVIPVNANTGEIVPHDQIAYNAYLNALLDMPDKPVTYELDKNSKVLVENKFNWSDEQISIFKDILQKETPTSGFDEVYKNTNNSNYQTRVVKNVKENYVALFEVNNLEGDISILLNNRNYVLYEEYNNLYLRDDMNNKVIVSKTTEITPIIATYAKRNTALYIIK